MALRYENTDAPSEETSSVISRSLASFDDSQLLHANGVDGSSPRMRDRMEDSRTDRSRRGLVGNRFRSGRVGGVPSPDEYFHGIESQGFHRDRGADALDRHDIVSSRFKPNMLSSTSRGHAASKSQGATGESTHSFVIPDTNVWHNFSSRDDDGMMQTLEEQELLSSIQELQRKLLEVREEKEAWAEDFDKQETSDGQGADGSSGLGMGRKGGAEEGTDLDTEDQKDDSTKHHRTNSLQERTKRIVVVSNRLPVSMRKIKKADGREVWTYEKTSGGLVSALRAAKEQLDFVWVGWVGQFIPEDERSMVRQALVNDFGCVPVFLEKSILNGYYHGFSNDILWPLFHYEPLPCFRPGVERKFDVGQWEAYRRANDIFANAIDDILEDGQDMVWVHDYHLMLLPKMLRRLRPRVPIGWFLHVPFPASDVYRMLPVRRKILEGVIAADLVGFHTYDYMRHFLSSASRILGVESSPKGITTKSGHFCALGVFPIGIEPAFFQNVLQRPSCQRRVAELCKRLGHVHILIGIDRLDYIKGMPHKLLAYEHLLKTHPEYHGNIVLIQVGVPSRVQVKEYQKLASQVNELVGRINGTFGTLDYSPIHYIQRPVSTEELCALYNVANACIITSVRDGMNLVSHEYVAMQEAPCPGSRDGPGMLVLSEFAGAAQSLSGAIRINPWNIVELASAMHQALTSEKALRELQQKKLYRYVSLHTSSVWAQSYVDELMASASARFATAKNRLERLSLRSPLKANANVRSLSEKRRGDDSNVVKEQLSEESRVRAGDTMGGPDTNRKNVQHTGAEGATNNYNLPLSSNVGVNQLQKAATQKSSSLNKEQPSEEAVLSPFIASVDLTQLRSLSMGGRRRRPRRLPIYRMLQAYKQAGQHGRQKEHVPPRNRVLIIDYDGLLSTKDAVPELSRPSPFVTSYLVQLAANPSNLLVVLSGRSRKVLEGWLTTKDGSPIDCAIGAENGVFFRMDASSPWEYMGLAQEPSTWKSQVLPMIQFFSERTPGSRVEVKDGSLTWFYGDSDPAFASWQGKELRVHLDEIMTNFAIMVTQTSQYLEVRSQGCTKARIVSVLLSRLRENSVIDRFRLPDFVFCVGVDQTSPSIFHATSKIYGDALTNADSKIHSEAVTTSPSLSSSTSQEKTFESVHATGATVSGPAKDNPEIDKKAHVNIKVHDAKDETAKEPDIDVAHRMRSTPSKLLAKETVHTGGLASIGVFTCFYGGSKERESTDADFYVDTETDLRKILRGIVKLSDAAIIYTQ